MNYYYITINNKNINQDFATKLFNEIAKTNLIRSFSFDDGYVSYNSRGVKDIGYLLDEYNIDRKDSLVMDEFNYAYYHMKPDGTENFDLLKIQQEIERDIAEGKFSF